MSNSNLQKALKFLNKGEVQYKVIGTETLLHHGTYIYIETSLFLGNGLNKVVSIHQRDTELEVKRLAEIIEDTALDFEDDEPIEYY